VGDKYLTYEMTVRYAIRMNHVHMNMCKPTMQHIPAFNLYFTGIGHLNHMDFNSGVSWFSNVLLRCMASWIACEKWFIFIAISFVVLKSNIILFTVCLHFSAH